MPTTALNPTVVLSVLALVVSVVSLAGTFYRNARSTQLRNAQDEAMRTVAARAIVLWEQLMIIVECQVKNCDIDSYVLPSVQKNAGRLEDALDHAIRVGLLHVISEADREHSLTLYAAFLQGLTEVADRDNPQGQPLETWTKQHLLMGMVRLLDSCRKYRQSVIPAPVLQRVGKKVDGMLERAWGYVLPD